MKLPKKIDGQKLILLIGTTVLLFADNLTWAWGNLVPYVDSYLRFTFGLENYGGTTWVIPLHLGLYAVGTAISDVLVKRAGPCGTILTGLVFYDFAFVLSYFTIQHSAEALVVTTGAMPGCGSGVFYGLALFVVSSLKSKYSGILLAIVTSGVTGGSLLTNEIMTHYTNPNNESPNLTVVTDGRTESYFTQQDVIDRVPSSFLVFAGTSMAIHLLAFPLIMSVFNKVTLRKSPNIKDITVDEKSLTSETPVADNEKCKEKSSLLENAKHKPKRCRSNNSIHDLDESEVTNGKRNNLEYHKGRLISFDGRNLASSEKQGNAALVEQTCSSNDGGQGSRSCGENSKPVKTDFTTLQMIKNPAFYALFLCYTSGDLSYVIVQNYYKLYGQIYIKDDHFITNASTVTVVAAVILRLGFGAMVDFLGVKNTLILFQSSLTIIAQIWYFSAMVNKWVYMIFTTGFRSLVTGVYVIFGAATLAVFGKTYFARNMSVLMFLCLAVNLFGPLIMEVILHDFGWYALCLVCSSVNFCGLCAAVIAFPRI